MGLQNSVLLKDGNGDSGSLSTGGAQSVVHTKHYHEIPGLQHETRDVLKQLNHNIAMLETLTGRLGFVLSEVRSLIRK